MPGVKVLHVSESDIAAHVERECPWQNVKAIPGILKAHYIMCEKEGHLRLFVDNAKDNVVANINYFDCESEMDVDDQDWLNFCLIYLVNSKKRAFSINKITEENKFRI